MSDKEATLCRIVLPDETCPFGFRAKHLLKDDGFVIEDRLLRSREEVDALEHEQDVETTPLIFIGSDDLERYLSA